MTPVRDPATGTKEFKGDNGNYSKVKAVLTAEVGGDAEPQKMTVTYEAVPYIWDSVAWFGENNKLNPEFVPKMDITLTLTGPDGATVSSEDITVVGKEVPYPLKAERVFRDLTPGAHKVTVSGVKTRGRKTTDGRNHTGKDRVVLGEQSVEYSCVSSPSSSPSAAEPHQRRPLSRPCLTAPPRAGGPVQGRGTVATALVTATR
ncbi:hypothetical protein ACH4FX_42125 [Streptomyces sp. NPDC018019]|uniref:hypothetical protein n=1 Tax=Streptomyces sp. NPDC018019 TaxID=3365030 RepID=UPI0037AF0565